MGAYFPGALLDAAQVGGVWQRCETTTEPLSCYELTEAIKCNKICGGSSRVYGVISIKIGTLSKASKATCFLCVPEEVGHPNTHFYKKKTITGQKVLLFLASGRCLRAVFTQLDDDDDVGMLLGQSVQGLQTQSGREAERPSYFSSSSLMEERSHSWTVSPLLRLRGGPCSRQTPSWPPPAGTRPSAGPSPGPGLCWRR